MRLAVLSLALACLLGAGCSTPAIKVSVKSIESDEPIVDVRFDGNVLVAYGRGHFEASVYSTSTGAKLSGDVFDIPALDLQRGSIRVIRIEPKFDKTYDYGQTVERVELPHWAAHLYPDGEVPPRVAFAQPVPAVSDAESTSTPMPAAHTTDPGNTSSGNTDG